MNTPVRNQSGGQGAPTPVDLPHTPTDEEQAYMEQCGVAITAGSDAAASAAATSNSEEYLRFAQGVAALTTAYLEIKNGGMPSRHQGS